MQTILEMLDRKPFAVIGHRGASGYVLENTISSIEQAIKHGADIVECDVQLSSDRIPIVFHDEDFNRLGGISKRVNELSLDEIRKIDLNGHKIPTLEEVLDVISDKVGLFIEIKDPNATDKVVDLIVEKDVLDQVAVISFHDEVLETVKRINNKVVTGLLYFKPPGRIFEAKKMGAKIVLPRYNIATKRANDTAHRLKLKVATWVVNTTQLAEKMYKNGVDAMATDYPDKIIEFRNSLDG